MGKQSTVIRTTSQNSIDQLFKNQIKKANQLQLPPQRLQDEDTDLQRAIQLSQQQHFEEQKRLLEQITQHNVYNQPTSSKSSSMSSSANNSNHKSVLNNGTQKGKSGLHNNKGDASPVRKRRLIQKDKEEDEKEDEEDEDDWFQTISNRTQKRPLYTTADTNSQKKSKSSTSLSKKKKKVTDFQQEKVESLQQQFSIAEREIVEIEDSQPLPQVKKEIAAAQESFEINDDVSDNDSSQDEFDPNLSFAENLRLSELRKKQNSNTSTNTSININVNSNNQKQKKVESKQSQCPICQQMVFDIIHHSAYCGDEKTAVEEESDSDCSVIDLIENPNAAICDMSDTEEEEPPILPNSPSSPPINNIYTEAVEGREEEEEEDDDDDDGYLSPLEGFTNINENNQEHNMYFAQLQNKPPKTRKTTAKKTTTKRSTTRKRTTTTGTKAKKWNGGYKKKFYRKKR